MKKGIPYVAVDGIPYYSDRFYILTSKSRDDVSVLKTCSCGSQQSLPTLDRIRLIQSLDLEAAIVGTYTLSPSLITESLFPQHLPVFVLHGQKGLEQRVSHVAHSFTRDRSKNVDNLESMSRKRKIPDFIGSSNLGKVEYHDDVDDEIPPEEAWYENDGMQNESHHTSIPETMHMTRVLTTWLPKDLTTSMVELKGNSYSSSIDNKSASNETIVIDDSDEEEEDQKVDPHFIHGVSPTVAKHRVSKRGVHHPKFMILFEKSGCLVVVVSTANLTSQISLDGIWMQRFQPRKKSEESSSKMNLHRRMDGSDFGHVLTDFLQKQSDAAQVGHMLPVEFLRRYTTFSSLDEFREAYRFEDSQVHLIATVPGEHGGSRSVTHLGRKDGRTTFLYGAQRVFDILKRLIDSKCGTPWIPADVLLSEDDRIICQPTSLGGRWTTPDMAALIRMYTGITSVKDLELLDKLDIIWPSLSFIQSLKTRWHEPRNNVTLSEDKNKNVNGLGGYIFLSSESFNTIDVNIISRMVQYENSFPYPLSSPCVPHFKSYARLFEGNDFSLRKNYGVGKAAEIFPWFLMSSACLSRGAQGCPRAGTEDSDTMMYSNFELGVLFCSRLQGSLETDRVYCWKPNRCSCLKGGNRQKLVHLPIPYCLRGKSYQADSDLAHFCETPYFHEIQPESSCIGLMALTPLGRLRASLLKSEVL
jgi:Tyrosyl-DNA phosphodiesterase